MKTIRFPRATKNGEKRLALLPRALEGVKYTKNIFLERNYGVDLGISDSEYEELGFKIADREQVLSCDIICDPKIGDAKL